MAFGGDSEGRQQSLQEMRRSSEVTMESFIKHQMVVILQPFIDHVQSLDAQLTELSDRLELTNTHLEQTNSAVDGAKAELKDMREGLVSRTNDRVKALFEGLERCKQDQEQLQQSLEHANGWLQRMQNQSDSSAVTLPELQRGLGRLEHDVHSLAANLERTDGEVGRAVKQDLARVGSELQELRSKDEKAAAELEQLRRDLERDCQLLRETRQATDANSVNVSHLQKGLGEMTSREAQLGARVEGWKLQWSKISPAIESLRKETAVLKQQGEHHTAVMHGLQQSYATTFGTVEALEGSHGKLRGDLRELREGLTATQRGLDEAHEGLGQATAFSNKLHTALEKTCGDVGRSAARLDSLDARHEALSGGLERAASTVADLSREHRSYAAHVQNLQQDLQRTNETLSTARSQLDAAHSGIQGLKSELGRTNDTVQRIDHGVEICHAGFSGLQKGFAETGTHMSTRPLTLPKLPRGDLRSPRGESSLSTSAHSSRRSSTAGD